MERASTVYDSHVFFVVGTFSELSCTDCIEQYETDNEVNPDEISMHAHWEGEPLTCDGCNKKIESAYGVPKA